MSSMTEKIATYVDRKSWVSGEWDGEPDRVEWTDEATGFVCLAKRGGQGAWCGYVGVPPGHRWHGVDLSMYPDGVDQPEVHGGITYAQGCSGDPEKGICHVPAPGTPEHLFWVGFDCNHSGDHSPERAALAARDPFWGPGHYDSYKTLAYAKNEIVSLARQAAAIAKATGGAP